MGSGIVEQRCKHIFNRDSAMDDAYSSSEDMESQDIIDVIGQGQLNEVCQQRGDEDSRRYRVFQHYLRTSGQDDKKKQLKHFHQDENGDKNGHLSFSSDSEVCEDNTHVEKKTLSKKFGRSFYFRKESEERKKEAETKPLTHKQEFDKRRKINQNMKEQ